MTDAMARFSDEALAQLRNDVDLLREQQLGQMAHMERLAEAIESNTRSTAALAESTQGIVQLYSDVQGATRLGVALQKFLAWLLKMGALGATLAACLTYVLSHFKLPPHP